MTRYIISPQEMYAAERAVFSTGRPSFELMEQAGRGVADLLHDRFPKGAIRVLCGPGGNGGDGFIAAARLKSLGREVSVFLLGPVDALNGDPKTASQRWAGKVEPLAAALSHDADITLDAMFGGGLSRPLQGVCAELTAASQGPVVSIDVPSGLDGLTARSLGPCFKASLTVTFAALRPAHVLSPGKHFCGLVDVVDIDVPVPVHTVYRKVTASERDGAVVFSDLNACEASLDATSPVPKNPIELARALAKQTGRAAYIERPDQILSTPTGEVIVAPDHGAAIRSA
ncbi:MAG: NAD(P)H-hydrate epimerase [Hyphomonadaceae bacterium]|nr:NAD(P)H-hydrate epimerase [Hyphomonadaceae bacterium]